MNALCFRAYFHGATLLLLLRVLVIAGQDSFLQSHKFEYVKDTNMFEIANI